MIKTYKDLTVREEGELVLWLGYLEESFDKAQTQMYRWNHSKNSWELEMFFGVLIYIDNSIRGLKKFLNRGENYYDESELWNILKQFRKDIKVYKIRDLRNDLEHREKIFQFKDKKGQALSLKLLLILGSYNDTTDEYQFGPNYKIKVSEIFSIVKKLKCNIYKIYKEKLNNFYRDKSNKYESMIPFSILHGFNKKHEDRAN